MSAKNLFIGGVARKPHPSWVGYLNKDAEPKNGLVNEIWAKSIAHEQYFRPFSVRQLNRYPNTMLEYILSSMEEFLTNQSRYGKKKKKMR